MQVREIGDDRLLATPGQLLGTQGVQTETTGGQLSRFTNWKQASFTLLESVHSSRRRPPAT